MVSDKVTVDTKAFGSSEAWHWESEGLSGYEITPGAKEGRGTTITLHLKADAEDENYSEFLDQFRIRQLVKKVFRLHPLPYPYGSVPYPCEKRALVWTARTRSMKPTRKWKTLKQHDPHLEKSPSRKSQMRR